MSITSDPSQDRVGWRPRKVTAFWPPAHLFKSSYFRTPVLDIRSTQFYLVGGSSLVRRIHPPELFVRRIHPPELLLSTEYFHSRKKALIFLNTDSGTCASTTTKPS